MVIATASAHRIPVADYVSGIPAGDRALLARAITLVESTNPEHGRLARSVLQELLPKTGAAVRLGMTGVLLGVLLAELYVSSTGIGHFTQLFTQAFDPTKLLGLISILAVMAITLNEIVRRAEVHFGRWRAG